MTHCQLKSPIQGQTAPSHPIRKERKKSVQLRRSLRSLLRPTGDSKHGCKWQEASCLFWIPGERTSSKLLNNSWANDLGDLRTHLASSKPTIQQHSYLNLPPPPSHGLVPFRAFCCFLLGFYVGVHLMLGTSSRCCRWVSSLRYLGWWWHPWAPNTTRFSSLKAFALDLDLDACSRPPYRL